MYELPPEYRKKMPPTFQDPTDAKSVRLRKKRNANLDRLEQKRIRDEEEL